MPNREGGDNRVVYLVYERVFGEMVGSLDAFYTTIRYTKGGIEFEVLMENDEFILLEDLIEYDSDDE